MRVTWSIIKIEHSAGFILTQRMISESFRTTVDNVFDMIEFLNIANQILIRKKIEAKKGFINLKDFFRFWKRGRYKRNLITTLPIFW